MIHTSKQLKDKVRNISKGDNNIAKALIRNFIMERFLERVSVSDYRNNIILKGGIKWCLECGLYLYGGLPLGKVEE